MTSKTGYAILERNTSAKRPITVVIWVFFISGILVLFEMLPLTCLVAYAEGIGGEMHFEELGFILVSKSLLRKVFDRLDKKHIEELGKEDGLTIAQDYVSYFYPEVNENTLVSYLEISILSAYG